MTTLSVSSAKAEPTPSTSAITRPDAPTMPLKVLMRFLHPRLCCFVAPIVGAFNTGSSPRESPICQRRRFLVARLGLVLGRAGLAFILAGLSVLLAGLAVLAAAARSLLAMRIDQYSQEHTRPVVLALIWPANFVSPGESVAMSEPIVSART